MSVRSVGWLVGAVALASCHDAARARVLSEIERARGGLAALASPENPELAEESIRLARRALVDAELAVRSEGPGRFEPLARLALDRTEIARWVVERERERQRAEASAMVGSAREAVARYRQPEGMGLHPSVGARMRLASIAIAEAERALADEDYRLADARALDAAELVSGLPEDAQALIARLEHPDNRETWRLWVIRTLQDARQGRQAALVVDKHSRTAMLWREGERPRFFDVELGYNGLARKLHSGDGATPEGVYHVTRKRGKGQTRYYKALLLSYPNAEDRERFEQARVDGRLSDEARIGGLIEIHGDGGRGTNWTDGCVAIENSGMDEIFQALSVGSPIAIVGHYDPDTSAGADP